MSDSKVMNIYDTAALLGHEDATRLYTLRIAGRSDTEFQVVSFTGREALSELYEFRVGLVASNPDIALAELEGRQASLSITLADGQRVARSGFIRSAAFLGADGSLAAYQLDLVPWLWLS